MVHGQKFKVLPSSKCPVWVGGACWTRNPGPVVQYSLGVRFYYWPFLFSRSKASDANIGIIVHFEKIPV